MSNMIGKRHRYFVMHLGKEHPQREVGKEFEIQLLDSKGRGKVVGRVGWSETELILEGHIVPKAVIEAARRQPEGGGDFVDASGQSIPRFYGAQFSQSS